MAAPRKIQREDQVVLQEMQTVMKKMKKSAGRAMEMMSLDQICTGTPSEIQKLEFTAAEYQILGMPDGDFGYNDPGAKARCLDVLDQMVKIAPLLEKIAEQVEIRRCQMREEIQHMAKEIQKLQEIENQVLGSNKITQILKIGGLAVAGVLFAQMPKNIQMAVGMAGLAGLAFKISSDQMDKME